MPLLLLLAGSSLLGVGALAFKSVKDDTQDVVRDTGPDLVVLALAGLGMYVAFKAVEKGRV